MDGKSLVLFLFSNCILEINWGCLEHDLVFSLLVGVSNREPLPYASCNGERAGAEHIKQGTNTGLLAERRL